MFAFYSEKQAKAGGFATWETSDGRKVVASEVGLSPLPIGKWDDYVFLGEVSKLIDSSIKVKGLSDTFCKPTTDGKLVIGIVQMLTKNTDINQAKFTSLKIAVCYFLNNKIDINQLADVANQLDVEPEDLAIEIFRQKESNKVVN